MLNRQSDAVPLSLALTLLSSAVSSFGGDD